MRWWSQSVIVLATSIGAGYGQYIRNELSFGHDSRVVPEGQISIPNFSIQGDPTAPELLSNRIILTPPALGNQRGAVWSDQTLQYHAFIADFEFRATGPERGGGNINIWIARDGPHAIGTKSIYTVSTFEGLALVVDTYGGSGGMVRGFLNDGTTDFRSQPDIDALSFGQCQFAYRNLGRPSQVKVRQSADAFLVEVDGRPCFGTDRLTLHTGYNLGVTAASADNPDSFEVFKVTVLTALTTPYTGDQNQPQQVIGGDQSQQHMAHQPPVRHGNPRSTGAAADAFDDDLDDVAADHIISSEAQFADLHTRLQILNHHISSVYNTITQLSVVSDGRHTETAQVLDALRQTLGRLDKLDALDARLASFQQEVRVIRSDLTRKVKENEQAIKSFVSDTHSTLSQKVVDHAAPSHTMLYILIIGGQACLLASYFYYKRRKSMPKKFV